VRTRDLRDRTHHHREIPVTAPELSPDEKIVLAHFDSQPAAPESFRRVLARELFAWDCKWYQLDEADANGEYGDCQDMADRAIEVMRGERSLDAPYRMFDGGFRDGEDGADPLWGGDL
jgi:hypothetical protein